MKRVVRSFAKTGAAGWLAKSVGATAPIAFVCFSLGRQSEQWPIWLGALALVTVSALVIVFLTWERWRAGRLLRELHAALPWLEPDAVTWVQPQQVRALREELEARRVPMHELDGATIHSPDDLVRVLAARFGARSFPADPIARADATLRSIAGRSRQVRVVLWHDAHEFATSDPAAFHSLLSRWLRDLPTRVLLMLVAPAPLPAAEANASLEPPHPPIEPDVAVLAAAPSRAWWKPRPGDLT